MQSALRRRVFVLTSIGVAVCLLLGGNADACGSDEIDFSRDIRPILSDKCFQCHGPDAKSREAELRLDTQLGLLRSVDGVTVVAPGKPDESELWRRIASADDGERMPPPDSKKHLKKSEIEILRRWIGAGAPWQRHWAFEPVVAPEIPGWLGASPGKQPGSLDSATATDDSRRPRGPIDALVQAKLHAAGFQSSPEAVKERLLRRVTLDLTGLPPTPEEIDAFLADTSPDAYERVVDRLLASGRYGERMAWEWLDAARFADSNGYQDDLDRTAWPWRDWVVRAMNRNMPYDRFTVEQIAGDLLPGAGEPGCLPGEATRNPDEQKLATAFCRNHMINGEGGRIPEENRVEYIFDQIETISTVWLAVTMNCCRCHDHKFDPISQREYYGLFAFFNQTPVDGGGRNPKTPPLLAVASDEQRERIAKLEQSAAVAARAVDVFEEELFPRPAGRPTSDSDAAGSLPKKTRDALAAPAAKRNTEQLTHLESTVAKENPNYAGRLKLLREFKEESKKLRDSIPAVMVMEERDGPPRDTFILNKGLYNQHLDKVEAGLPAIFPPLAGGAKKNRLALARWLVEPSHPLTARVTVNRYWQTFFGTGLVKTVEDFGTQGERPVQQELLDHLASEFVRSGWDVKAIHRRIVTSATYRQTAKTSPEWIERDPDNRLLARGPRGRMPSWMIRDQALAAGGLLVSRIGGPPVKPYQPAGIWREATFGRKTYVQDHGEKLYRRSIYTFWRRIEGPTIFFDAAKRQTCSVRRTHTNTPLHALSTLGDTTYVEAARVLAQRVMQLPAGSSEPGRLPDQATSSSEPGRLPGQATSNSKPGCLPDQATSNSKPGCLPGQATSNSDEQRIAVAFRLATSRWPDSGERKLLVGRLETLKEQYAADLEAAKKIVQAGEMPSDASLDAVTHAAYTGVCLLILNLDETLSR